jgi:hydrogenase-4 component F
MSTIVAPVAAILAGVMETVAVYAVLRSKAIMDHTLTLAFTENLMMLFGPISFVLAAFFMRLFAYSSMERMGLATVGLCFALPEPVRGLRDRAVAILMVRQEYG